MPVRWISGLRNHAHVLLIVPLVVIVMTWPTFARVFDGDEFWLHTAHGDLWLRIWDAWHIKNVFAGQAELFYTDSMFHPQGLSLAFVHYSLPHALLFIALNNFLPADNVYNLLFMMILCFNAYCTYPLILHLLGDKWIALFGAVVVTVSVPFLFESTIPDLIMIGTIPLSTYFFHRHFGENRWIFAALAGLCAGANRIYQRLYICHLAHDSRNIRYILGFFTLETVGFLARSPADFCRVHFDKFISILSNDC